MSRTHRVLPAWAPLALAAFTLTWAAPPGAEAQEFEPRTDEEVAERAAAAEAAPLFASHERLAFTLRTDIKWLRDERSDEEEVEGTVTLVGADGAELELPVKVRTRGNFRREKRNCNFPPLRLNFPRSEMEGTVFEGQDRLKLVTPCHDSRDSFQQYVLQEYLVYRVFALLTPQSYRVRLVDITYEDVNGEYDSRTKTAFLIESDDQMADRNRAQMSDWEFFHPGNADSEQAAMVALFQYMIGNTDWSAPYFHNTKLVRRHDGAHLVIAYDFDFSGVVNARYATPDPQLGIRNVRQRVFRGFCRDEINSPALIQRFNDQREAIWALYTELEGLEEGQSKRALEYYERFYETINDEGRFNREILRACRQIP